MVGESAARGDSFFTRPSLFDVRDQVRSPHFERLISAADIESLVQVDGVFRGKDPDGTDLSAGYDVMLDFIELKWIIGLELGAKQVTQEEEIAIPVALTPIDQPVFPIDAADGAVVTDPEQQCATVVTIHKGGNGARDVEAATFRMTAVGGAAGEAFFELEVIGFSPGDHGHQLGVFSKARIDPPRVGADTGFEHIEAFKDGVWVFVLGDLDPHRNESADQEGTEGTQIEIQLLLEPGEKEECSGEGLGIGTHSVLQCLEEPGAVLRVWQELKSVAACLALIEKECPLQHECLFRVADRGEVSDGREQGEHGDQALLAVDDEIFLQGRVAMLDRHDDDGAEEDPVWGVAAEGVEYPAEEDLVTVIRPAEWPLERWHDVLARVSEEVFQFAFDSVHVPRD